VALFIYGSSGLINDRRWVAGRFHGRKASARFPTPIHSSVR
jgi:hypothetical protein